MADKSKTILILDGEARSALATARSLGEAGFNVLVASEVPNSLASQSRFVMGNLSCPEKSFGPDLFCLWLKEILSNYEIDHLIPVSEFSLNAIYQDDFLREFVQKLPFPSLDTLKLTLDKFDITKIALEHDIHCPKVVVLESSSQNADQLINILGFPIVFKPRQSVQYVQTKAQKPPIKYARNKEDVENFLSSRLARDFSYLAQEYISGNGVGLFFLISDNEVYASFAHKRILEKPPEGGVSVLCESYHPHPEVYERTFSFLKSINWEGAAMVEFKLTDQNKLYLMEINPRFWGSLQLAIDCQINFPKILVTKRSYKSGWNNFKEGQRLRWELGLLDHFLIKVKRNPTVSLKQLFLDNSLQFFNRQTKNEVLRWNDLQPFMQEIKDYFSLLIKRS